MTTSPDTNLIEAGRRLTQLDADQKLADAAVENLLLGTPERAAAHKAINARGEVYLTVLEEIIAQPATTRSGIEAKARALLMHIDDDGALATFEDRLSRSLAQDVVTMIERATVRPGVAA